jgi:hypothetical protein
MMTNSITLNLPDTIFQRAKLAAKLLNRSIEEVLESTLSTSLPVLDDTPTDLAADLAKLPTLTDAELWQVARSKMAPEHEALLHQLLDTQSERQLTANEARQLEALRQQAGKLTLIKSQAYASCMSVVTLFRNLDHGPQIHTSRFASPSQNKLGTVVVLPNGASL